MNVGLAAASFRRLLIGVTLAVTLVAGEASAEAPAVSAVPAFKADSDIARQYADYCALDLLAAAVPDPRIPRHRRGYDQTIAAITQGMLDGGYVLDRYDLPWLPSKNGVATRSSDYGLLLFRDDGWRNPPQAGQPISRGTALRAVYLLPETATDGLHAPAVDAVLARIHAQLREVPSAVAHCVGQDLSRAPGIRLAAFHGCAADQLLVLGPVFSGSLDALAQRTWALGTAPSGLCAVSSSTTARSNHFLAAMLGDSGGTPRLSFQQLAVGDDHKMLALAQLAAQYGIPPKRVAFLSESTVFGTSICPAKNTTLYDRLSEDQKSLCDGATQIGFPSNISSIRQGAQQEADALRSKNPLPLPVSERHLPIADIGDIESELPESQQSRLTAASVELELTDVLDRLKADRPEMVVVVATDVRDRAFLFDQVRRLLPRVLLIDFETDRLLAHPDFAHASRGVLTLASSELDCLETNDLYCRDAAGLERQAGNGNQRRSNWSTDRQAILQKAVSRIGRGVANCPDVAAGTACEERPPLLHVVGYDQVRPLTSSRVSVTGLRAWLQGHIGLLTVIYSLTIVTLWLSEYFSTHGDLKIWDWIARPASRVAGMALAYPLVITALLLVAGALDSLLAVLTCLALVALLVYVIPILRQMAIRPGVHVSALERTTPRTAWTLILWLALAAVWFFERLRLDGLKQPGLIDAAALTGLSLDPESGLAYQLVLVLAATVTLMAFTTILAAVARTNRNAALLRVAAGEDADAAKESRPSSFVDVADAYQHFLHWRDPLLLIGLALVGALLVSIIGYEGLSQTVFGPDASRAALSCLAITTMTALALLCAQISLGKRILAVSTYVRQRVLSTEGAAPVPAEGGLGCWPQNVGAPLSFPRTPVAAWNHCGGAEAQRLRGHDRPRSLSDEQRREQIIDGLKALFTGGCSRDPQPRLALFVYLTGELFLFRFVGLGATLSTLTGVAILYLFPVTGATPFLLLNLALLAIVGLLSGHYALRFEYDDVLSNIVCNQPRAGKVSTALFGYIAFPFLILAIAITLSQTPGVLGWSGGLIRLLLKTIGLGGL
ncbi:hypothetical protein [Nevskia sp.]|uniref:hypothetical protein n=1 Tax=Nevskia sp. TaxID=1929292 RepID=UPI0025F68D15|nr:hypothetical protein [Nevskia sp.]